MPPSRSPSAYGELSVAILVVSCDGYRDLWGPFFSLLERFWPVRPGPMYLVTNHERPALAGVRVLAVGPDASWSHNLASALGRIEEEYVLMFLEDLFLCGQVDGERIGAILGWASEHRPNHIRLNPTEKPYAAHDELVGLVPSGAPYRTSTPLTLWKKETLTALLRDGESAWQFELHGSERSDRFEGFYSAHERCFPVENGVIRGKWRPSSVRRLRSLGVSLDLGARRVMTVRESLGYQAIALRARLFKLVPWEYRRRIRRLRPV